MYEILNSAARSEHQPIQQQSICSLTNIGCRRTSSQEHFIVAARGAWEEAAKSHTREYVAIVCLQKPQIHVMGTSKENTPHWSSLRRFLIRFRKSRLSMITSPITYSFPSYWTGGKGLPLAYRAFPCRNEPTLRGQAFEEIALHVQATKSLQPEGHACKVSPFKCFHHPQILIL
jgi:hypothetical protein